MYKYNFIALVVSILFVTTGNNTAYSMNKSINERTTITILQTADIHAQLDTHQELFVEDGKVPRKWRIGGY